LDIPIDDLWKLYEEVDRVLAQKLTTEKRKVGAAHFASGSSGLLKGEASQQSVGDLGRPWDNTPLGDQDGCGRQKP
jgi:hypothetical protein